MSVKFDIATTLWWDEHEGIDGRKLSVFVNPMNDVVIRYRCSGVEDQVLNMDEHAWHALYEMLGEVKP
jgi:hypothetical protein